VIYSPRTLRVLGAVYHIQPAFSVINSYFDRELEIQVPLSQCLVRVFYHASQLLCHYYQINQLDVMFNKRVGVFYHNIKHDA
jgi:hypothetical protein